jgi:hypothetical protein
MEIRYLCPPSDEKTEADGSAKGTTAVKPQLHHIKGSVVQLVRMLPCHGRGRGFESRPVRHNSLIINLLQDEKVE